MSKNQRMRLDHLAVWVSDMDKTVEFLTDTMGFRKHPMVVEVADDCETTGGMRAEFVDGNGLWLEMILPTTPGPGMDMLEELGDGAIVEVNFEAVDSDYREILTEMETKGVQMLNMDGTPLKDWGRIDEGVAGDDDSHETGQYIAYWPADVSRGTTIEVYEKVSDDKTNLLNIRNGQWTQESSGPNGLRMDSVNILVEDLDDTAKFYTETMELERHPDAFDVLPDSAGNNGAKCAFIKANAADDVWIQLIQPTSPGHAMDLLKQKGNGYAAEISVEVDDIDAYCDEMQNKGITMVNLDGSPLAAGTKAITVQPYGDRQCYFPVDASRGMRIRILERGSSNTSMLHKRDQS